MSSRVYATRIFVSLRGYDKVEPSNLADMMTNVGNIVRRQYSFLLPTRCHHLIFCSGESLNYRHVKLLTMGIPQIPLITVQPSAPHTHTVVFLHGRGDRVHNFEASLHHSMRFGHKNYAEAMPSVRWVFPQAPMRKCASLPDTWPQWFDVWDVRNFADNEELQAEGLKEVVPEIRKILAREAARLGGRWDRLVIAGISMGGATSVHTLFNLNVPEEGGGRLGAFIGFSCRCPFVGRTLGQMREVLGLDDVPDNNEVLRKTPILLEHCADDPLVLVQNGRAMRDALRGFGATVEWKEYPTGGHWFQSPDGGADMMDFLRRVLEQNVPTQASSSAMDLS